MPDGPRAERADRRVRRSVREGRHRPGAGHAPVARARGVGGGAAADHRGARGRGADRPAWRDHRPRLRRPRRGHGPALLPDLDPYRYGRPGERAPGRPYLLARDPDRALARAADRVPRGLPPPLRRHVQRDVPGLQVAAGDGLRARGRSARSTPSAGTGCRPGATVTLRPLVGARSLLLLEGAEHLSRRKVMLPPFHGERMRAYEPVDARGDRARARRAGRRARVRGPPEHAGDHARGDPARGLRRQPTRRAHAARRCCATCWRRTVSTQLQVSVLFGRRRAARARCSEHGRARSTRCCSSEIAERAPPRRRRATSARCSSQARFEDGSGDGATARSATS